jgi:hypothetical protein
VARPCLTERRTRGSGVSKAKKTPAIGIVVPASASVSDARHNAAPWTIVLAGPSIIELSLCAPTSSPPTFGAAYDRSAANGSNAMLRARLMAVAN